MITLHTFGPAFGLPDPSPFVTKTQILLKMAGLPYRTDIKGFNKAPKGKLPYIEDAGETIPDSTFIRWHIEKKYGIDFDRGLDASQRAIAWAFEKTLEDNLYWVVVVDRWVDDRNFDNGPRSFFNRIPAPLRALIIPLIRRKVRKSAYAHGMGRHSRAEVARLGIRTVESVSDHLADKPYFMGATPTGVDATVFAFVASVLSPTFETPVRTAAEKRDNLRRYIGRLTAQYYPEMGEVAGCKAAA